jgi:hypothetical protein
MKKNKFFPVTFANDNSALVPEVWAMEALTLLHANTVLLPTINTQFKNEIARQGELVHAHRARKFEAERKVDGDNVTIQDAIVDDVEVRLDFHLHTSFMIYDGERSKSMKDLVEFHMTPAFQSIFQEVDELIAAMKYRFMSNAIVGQLGTALTKSSLVTINKIFQTNKTPQGRMRWFMMGPQMEADLLEEKLFTDASQVGDDGSALREGSIGRKFGVNCVMSQNMPTVDVGNTVTTTTAINNVGGYGKGDTVLTVDGGTTIIAGSWCVIAGDERPRRIVTVNADPATQITLEQALDFDVVDDAVVTVYEPGAINEAAGYAANYTKRLTVDGFTVSPQGGQLTSFGTTGTPYGLIGALNSTTSLKLDRGLDTALADDVVAAIGPAGEYGFAYHRDAVTLVSRPLALPETDTGAKSAVASDANMGVGVRATVTYNGEKQGHLVTVDMLCGTEVLDITQGMLVVR